MATYVLLPRKEDDLLKHLLQARGIDEKAEETFLFPDYDTGRHDPYLLNDMDKAVQRLELAIQKNEHIAIFSDYDCDGIPGAVILHDFLKAIGHENFTNHIPHRHFDGFGLSEEAVRKMKEAGASLILTIDCGAADIEAAKLAKELEVDLIITDHHEPKAELPVAVAVVNPRVGDTYPFPHLCGAAVVFKVVEAMLARSDRGLKPGQEKWWLDMVALATIGDMVPLQGENRIYSSFGLKVLRKSRRPGLQHLFRKARASQVHATEDDIGFTLAPRINAASRMDSPEQAFLMLAESDLATASLHAEHLEKLNNERKGVVAAMTKELKRRVEEMVEVPQVLVMGNPEWRPALVGLCANGLSEQLARPVFLWGRDGNGIIKGSCRSHTEVSVLKIMESASEHFLEHGGHHASGGFSVREDSVFHLSDVLNQALVTLGEKAAANEQVLIDAVLSLEDVDRRLLEHLRSLAPFGVGNHKPLFAFKDVSPSEVQTFGKSREHLKLTFATGRRSLEAVAFFSAPEQYTIVPTPEERFTLLAHVEETFFMNRLQTRLRIVDIVPRVD